MIIMRDGACELAWFSVGANCRCRSASFDKIGIKCTAVI